MSAVANDLEAGFEILWYKIESVLGRGGFGITYLAKDNNLDQLVAIKEYLPHDFATRSGDSTVQPASVDQEDIFTWGLERFMSEAQTLAKFKHPNIVRVLSVFRHNNTGYMVMEYEQGEDLSNRYKRKKILSQSELETIYYPIIDGLAAVHKEGFIHRDIKPANIYIRSDGSPVLIDFGAARQAVGSKTKTLTSMLSIGYAPFEQYNDGSGKQGPWTDIYALGASLHQAIAGEKPMESTIRGIAMLHDEPDPYEPLSHARPEGYSLDFLKAIDKALMLQIHDRPQNLEDFLAMLRGEIILPDIPVVAEKVGDSTEIRNRTVIRPSERKFSGAQFEATHPGKPSGNEQISNSAGDPADIYETERITKPPKSAGTKQSLLSRSKYLFGLAGVVAIVAIVAIFLSREPTPEEIQQQKIESLLEKADELIADGKYFDDSGNAAFSIYQQILVTAPDSAAAKNGIDSVARHHLEQADRFIDKEDFAQADSSLKIVNSIDPGYPGLSDLLVRYSDRLAATKQLKQIEIVIDLARAAMAEGRIYEPPGKSALFHYQNLLKLDADNVTAKLGLFQIADTLVERAQAAINENDTQRAETLITLAESIDPDKPSLKSLREQIGKNATLDKLLAKADAAYARNAYTTPKQDNAYELYKQVLSIAPSNPRAQTQLDQIAEFYADRTRRFTRSGNIASANFNLDILENFFPEYSGVSNLKNEIDRKQAQIKPQIKEPKPISEPIKDTKKPPVIVKELPIPGGVNQKQDDFQVAQDIVGLFIDAFNKRDMAGLLKVAQLTSQQQALYSSIFTAYQSLNIKVAPNSFTLNKKDGLAKVKFEIGELVDANGNIAVTSAGWTKIEVNIIKENGNWLKAVVK